MMDVQGLIGETMTHVGAAKAAQAKGGDIGASQRNGDGRR